MLHGLSEDARKLLSKAVNVNNNNANIKIHCRELDADERIVTNGQDLPDSSDRRSVLKCKAALQELVNAGVLKEKPLSQTNKDYFLTHKGYEFIDQMAAEE